MFRKGNQLVYAKKISIHQGIPPSFRFQAENPLDIRYKERSCPLDFHA